MADKPKYRKTVKRKTVTKSPEVLAGETLIAVLTSHNMTEAAEKLGITRQMVHERINRYDLKEKIANLKHEAMLELQMGANKAVYTLVKSLDSQNEAVAKGAADSILDRVGLTKTDNMEQKGNTYIFSNTANFTVDKYRDAE